MRWIFEGRGCGGGRVSGFLWKRGDLREVGFGRRGRIRKRVKDMNCEGMENGRIHFCEFGCVAA